jgi:hypothetical protein
MPYHRRFLAPAIMLGLLFLTTACTQMTPGSAVSTPSPGVRSTPTSSPALVPTATPPPLGAAPQNCPRSPAPRPIFPDVGPGVGSAPVWAFGLDTTLRIPTYFTYTPEGWTWKVIWRMSAGYSHLVSLHARNLHGGTPLWFQIDEQALSTSPVLDAWQPDRSSVSWVEWGSYLYFPVASCYQVQAIWPGGQWSFSFAVGRQ